MGGAASSTAPTTPTAKVSEIFIYPVKSCRGISLSEAPLTPSGLRWDRQWMVVNAKGRGCTQRVEPKFALIEVEFPPEAFLEHWEPTADSFMVLKAPGMEPLKVSLKKEYEVTDDIGVWEWTGSAWDEGAEAAQWFSDFTGKPCKLVRFNTASEVRKVDPDYVEGTQQTLFTDGYPFLLASQDSLDALNQLLEKPISISRFRPNIVVEGCEPFSEDLWKDIKINRFSFQGVKLCGRCKVPTIDQETGEFGTEPTETMMKTRAGKIIRPNDKNKNMVYFGQNIVWNWRDSSATGDGKVLKVGDPVYVLRQVSSPAEAAA